MAKLFDPIFESLKHGPEAEKGANIVPQIGTVFDTVHTVEVWILSYCWIELPTAENILVELDPMSRTVTATSKTMTANMTAYSATS